MVQWIILKISLTSSGICPDPVSSGLTPMKYYSNGMYIRYCQGFTEVPPDIPQNSTHIYLAGNQIKTLKENSFNHSQCQNLKIYWDELENIELGAFNNLDNLIGLCLFNNKLTAITSGVFSELPLLSTLQLQNNEIQTLSWDIFTSKKDEHPAPLQLSISGNPLTCNSSLCWMAEAVYDGWLVWLGGISFGPQCTDLTTWSEVNPICGIEGKLSKITITGNQQHP